MARNAITGADTIAALKVATTFGTAATFAAGDRIEFENLDAGRNPAELTASPKGSGQIMANESQQGAIAPVITIDKLEHYNDAGTAAEAVFWGSEGVTTIQTPSAFTHSFTCSDTFNRSYLTAAFQFTGGSIMEAASCAPTRLSVSYKPNDYSRVSLELLANDIIQEGVVNSYSAMQSLTIANTERIVAFPDDEFLINIQSGSALASPTDRLGTVEQIDITYEKPQEHTQEFKGSLGNGEPVPVGDPPFSATVLVTLSGLDASTYFQRARENVEFKAQFTVTGGLLIGGAYAKIVREFPRLKLVKDPVYSVSSAGINKVTLEFKALVASSTPSGMLSTYPGVKITNGRYAGYL